MESLSTYGAAKGYDAGHSASATSLAPTKPLDAHASKLHDLASSLGSANGRLAMILERVNGPIPEASSKGEPQPEPRGVLMVAQFGAERISRQISELNTLIERIESIV